MKKELFAAITIASLLLGAFYNILHLQRLHDSIYSYLHAAIQSSQIENYNAAETYLSDAFSMWLNADGYTHIFIRHSEIDTISDAFYDALSDVIEEKETSVASISKVEYHINSIHAMEKITLKSVF